MIELWAKDRDHPDTNIKRCKWVLRKVKRSGKVFVVQGRETEFFTLKTMAEALDRTTMTILMWEKKGLFPKPMFEVPLGRPGTRWYSKEQILNVHHLMLTKYNGWKHIKDPELFKQFLADVKSVFYKREVVIEYKHKEQTS